MIILIILCIARISTLQQNCLNDSTIQPNNIFDVFVDTQFIISPDFPQEIFDDFFLDIGRLLGAQNKPTSDSLSFIGASYETAQFCQRYYNLLQNDEIRSPSSQYNFDLGNANCSGADNRFNKLENSK